MDTYLYNMLDTTEDLSDRLMFLRTAPYNAYTINQPSILAELFIVKTETEALQVAKAFAYRFQPNALDRETSNCADRFMTILDHLDKVYSYEKDLYLKLLIDAFTQVGFKRASECDVRVLWMNYCCDRDYSNYPIGVKPYIADVSSNKRCRDPEMITANKRIRLS